MNVGVEEARVGARAVRRDEAAPGARLLPGLLAVRPSSPSPAHKLAVVGSLAFSFQTAVLDAAVWPVFFPA
jgi:hypothetical protein